MAAVTSNAVPPAGAGLGTAADEQRALELVRLAAAGDLPATQQLLALVWPTVVRVVAGLTGQLPPDSHLWIVTDGVPAFVRFEGPLYSGPVWRISLTSPGWPQ